MANLNYIFRQFNDELSVTDSKKSKMINSREHLREKIRKSFEQNHKSYSPKFYIQGSYKLKTLIRTKDDTCDLDDGVYFTSNPDNVTGTTLQRWVKEAVEGTTDATPIHKRKCIRVDYKAGYNIDLPVMVFDENTDNKTDQMVRIIKYLKAWCDHKRAEMPCGLAMTVLSLKYFQGNDRDDVALKYILIEIEKHLKKDFKCIMPTTPKDNLFADYSEEKKKNFMDNLSSFIEDAKKAIDEPNHQKASKLWQKHLGERFPLGEDKSDENSKSLIKAIGTSKPYYNGDKQ